MRPVFSTPPAATSTVQKGYNADMDTRALAARVRMLFLDVDGTLTDGRLYFFPQGVARAFHTLDGYGIRMLIKSGVQVAIVTAAEGDDIGERARYLGITRVHTGVQDKLSAVKQILYDESCAAEESAYMGDDLPDLPPLQYVGLAAAPPTAAAEVLAAAHWRATRPAGAGAVRELCELIMAARS